MLVLRGLPLFAGLRLIKPGRRRRLLAKDLARVAIAYLLVLILVFRLGQANVFVAFAHLIVLI